MKIRYDAEGDILRILFKDVPIVDSDEDPAGVIQDFDAEGNLVGIEILDASAHAEAKSIEFKASA